MGTNLRGRHFLALEDFTPDEIKYLLNLSHTLKAEKNAGMDQKRLVGKNMLMLFEMGSTRTRCAFETSACDLGMGTTYLSNSHFGTKETVKDSMRVFTGMYDAIAYRGLMQGDLIEMAKNCGIPIINAYTSHEHPTQMLADFMTMEEIWGRDGYKDKTLCYVGRGGSAAAFSYALTCGMLGMNFKYITSFMDSDEALSLLKPEELKTFKKYADANSLIGWESRFSKERKAFLKDIFCKYSPNCSFIETDDLDEVKGADVLTTENWGYFTDHVATWLPGIMKYREYQVNKELINRVENQNVIVLHMLPATHNCEHKGGQELLEYISDKELAEFLAGGLEVTDEVFEENSSVIFREAENRQHTIKAVIQAVVGT